MPERWLNIVGTVDLVERTGSIDYVQLLTADEVPTGQTEGVALTLLGPQSAFMDEIPARVKFDTHRSPNPEEHFGGVLDTFAPHDERITAIQLTIDGRVVATHPDPQQPAPRYDVLISPDDGNTWQTVAVGITDWEAFEVEPTDFPDARSLLRRVVTEGFTREPVSQEYINQEYIIGEGSPP